MDAEHRHLITKTWELIEVTRDEVLRLREEIELARNTVNRSHVLLSRTQRSAHRVKEPPKPL